MTLEQQLDAIIAEHGLSSLTITQISDPKFSGPIIAIGAQADGLCGSSTVIGGSIESGITVAIDALNAKRHRPAVIPTLAAAA